MKKDIFYWSPYLGKVATIRSVLNSMIGLKTFTTNKFNISLINCYGEWDNEISNLKKKKIDIINIQKRVKFSVDTYGFLASRIIYLKTLFITYYRLKNLLKEKQPYYLIIHLLTFIPIILFLNNNFKTKLILRISGKPKLTFFRNILWKLSNKKLHLVFCPTEETIDYLKGTNIFDKNKILHLPDPILDKKVIARLTKKKIDQKFKKDNFFLSIGRLTKQKNHELLIKMFYYHGIKEKLLIIGDGELLGYLRRLIKDYKLSDKIKIINYQKNIFYYIKKCKAVVITSLWEDPGFVMVESAHMKKPIICSDCPSGPKEFINNNKGGFLFKSNSIVSLKNAFINFKKINQKLLLKKLSYAKKQSKIFCIENHSKIISKYLS